MIATRAHRILAAAAVLLGFGALVSGAAPAEGGRVDVARLAEIVERELDHVDAIELAAWIRDRKPGLRIVNVRGAEDFAEFHLPNAEHLSLTELVRAPFGRDETVVIYSEGGTHAAQGWFFLRAVGIERVYFLRGGLYEWLTEVMNPTLPADATPEQRAAFQRAAALSRYFGGVPRIGSASTGSYDASAEIPPRASGDDHDHADPGGGSAEAVRRVRRRGC